MADLIRVNSTFTVRPDKLREFKQVVKEFVARVSANDHDTLSYEWVESDDGSEFRVLEVHKDEEAIRTHLSRYEPHTERFEALCEMTRAEVYGDISAELRAEFEAYDAVFYRSLEGFTR